MASIEEQIEEQRQRVSQAQQRASVRIPQRTVKSQFALGQSAFQAEKQARTVRQQRRKALGEFSLAKSQLDSLEEQQREQQRSQSSGIDEGDIINRLVRNRPLNPSFFDLPKEERARLKAIAEEIQANQERNIGRQAVVQVETQLGQTLTPELRKSVVQQAVSGSSLITLKSPKQVFTPLKTDVMSSNVFQSKAPKSTAGIATNIPDFGSKQLQSRITSSKQFQEFTSKLFPEAQPTKQSVAIFGEEKAKRVAQDIRTVGITAGLSFAGTPRLPKVIKTPARPLSNKAFGIQFQETVVSQGIPRTEASYQILTERLPPMKILDTRKSGGALGSSDKFNIQPAKYELTRTAIPATEKQALTLSTKTGKRFELDILTGGSKDINLETEFNQLTKTQKFLFRRQAEQKAGRPVSDKFVSKVLGKSDRFSVGEITKTLTAKNVRRPTTLANIRDQFTGLKATGKSTTRAETSTRTKSLFETDDFEIFESNTLFKDITKPFSRARGKTPRLKEFIIQRKEPRIIDDVTGVNVYKPSPTSKRTPLSLTFGKQKLIQVPKPLPKIAKQPRQKVISTSRTSRIGGVGSLLSRSGSGNVASSSSSFSSDFARGFQDNNIFGTLAQPKESGITKTQPLSISRNLPLETSIPRYTQFSLNIPRNIPREIARNVPRNIPREIARNVPREIARQIPRQIAKQVPRQVPRQPPRTPRPFNPRFPLPRTPKLPKFPLPNIKMGGKSKGIFGRGKQPLRYTPSFTGSTRFSILGKGATVTSKEANIKLGLPTVRGVIFQRRKKRKKHKSI